MNYSKYSQPIFLRSIASRGVSYSIGWLAFFEKQKSSRYLDWAIKSNVNKKQFTDTIEQIFNPKKFAEDLFEITATNIKNQLEEIPDSKLLKSQVYKLLLVQSTLYNIESIRNIFGEDIITKWAELESDYRLYLDDRYKKDSQNINPNLLKHIRHLSALELENKLIKTECLNNQDILFAKLRLETISNGFYLSKELIETVELVCVYTELVEKYFQINPIEDEFNKIRWPSYFEIFERPTKDPTELSDQLKVQSPLKLIGYDVSKNKGLSDDIRAQRLIKAFEMKVLPSVGDKHYMKEWGPAKSYTRLRRIINQIISNINRSKHNPLMGDATDKWLLDLSFLRERFKPKFPSKGVWLTLREFINNS